ncbi:MAG: TonB-dependent receptor plug domain-containing protein, partial [Gammaproteobacteria bacterium]
MTKVNFHLYIKGLAVFCLMISGTPAALSAEETIMEEVVVTGSRIARDATDFVGPTTIISAERFEMTGQTDLVEILNQIPSVTQASSIGRNAANGGIGTQRVELRNLETTRTLVLRDGRRAVNQMLSSTSLGVDLNAFPVNMIDRVEVLADGASAIYGSDAVAGVVNVILRKDFEGLEFSLKGGAPQDDGYEQYTASMIVGHASDRGNITFSVEYTDREEIDDFDRDWAKVPLLGELNVGGGTVLQLIGSGIPPT